MKHTETYKFNLPEGSDARSLAPLGENMTMLDAILKKLDAVLSLTGLSVVEPGAGRRLGELEVGSLVKLNENGAPKPYILLGQNHYGQGESVLLRKDALGPRTFRDVTARGGYDAYNGVMYWDYATNATNAFAGSDYDTFHNVLHVQTLDPLVRACLVNVPIPCCRGWVGTAFDATVDTLRRKCFPLSCRELWTTVSGVGEEGTVFPYFEESAAVSGACAGRVAYYDGTQAAVLGWGLRTAHNSQGNVYCVTKDGSLTYTGAYNARSLCPRPALTLSPELLVTGEPDGDGCYSVVGLPAGALGAGAAV